MFTPATAPQGAATELITQLGDLCRDRGLPDLAVRLADLDQWMRGELRDFEHELATLPRGARAIQRSAHHLLDLGGKHLRPMCVALAAKIGTGFDGPAQQLAVAVELIHTATLLHDDVVDLGDKRRGAEAARLVYGNAASIFAGDWLLIEALRRVRRAGPGDLLDRVLAIIEEMILAESLQLERRGSLDTTIEDYFRVVEGKTAALFRWAMFAGGRAGGLDDDRCAALERYGLHLGVAFQLVDDCLDYGGDSQVTGKSLHADLREGKLTYPLLLAMQRDPAVGPALGRIVALDPDQPVPELMTAPITRALSTTGALRDCRALALEHARDAIEALAPLPAGPGTDALITVAEATVYRER